MIVDYVFVGGLFVFILCFVVLFGCLLDWLFVDICFNKIVEIAITLM